MCNIFDDAIDYYFSTIYLGNLPAHLMVREVLIKDTISNNQESCNTKVAPV